MYPTTRLHFCSPSGPGRAIEWTLQGVNQEVVDQLKVSLDLPLVYGFTCGHVEVAARGLLPDLDDARLVQRAHVEQISSSVRRAGM